MALRKNRRTLAVLFFNPPAEREKATAILVEAAKTRAVVVVEHDMEFVRRLNGKVAVLNEGVVLAEGSLDHVTQN